MAAPHRLATQAMLPLPPSFALERNRRELENAIELFRWVIAINERAWHAHPDLAAECEGRIYWAEDAIGRLEVRLAQLRLN